MRKLVVVYSVFGGIINIVQLFILAFAVDKNHLNPAMIIGLVVASVAFLFFSMIMSHALHGKEWFMSLEELQKETKEANKSWKTYEKVRDHLGNHEALRYLDKTYPVRMKRNTWMYRLKK